MKNKKGFTLIELLVVIAIIGLLSTMTVYAINIARMKARDTRRKADLLIIAKALEHYYDDYGHYPVSNACGSSRSSSFILSPETNLKGLYAYHATHSSVRVIATLKTRGYIGSYITDPLDPNFNKYYYRYYTDELGQNFALMTNLEDPSAEDLSTSTLEPPLVSECSYGNYRLVR
jgi:prepilin-type N-terminal cleavage/methylation domain-containing protein